MKKRQLGHSALKPSVLTFGCWQAGGSDWSDTNDADSIAAMKAAYEVGINAFDTAEGYGNGHSERIVGQFLREVAADDILVFTKVGAGNLSASKVRSSCEKSLQNLGRDTIDLYQIHWPAGTWGSALIPIEETMSALQELQTEGKIGAIGVSNFDGTQIEEALQFGRIDSLQPPYSLFFQPYVANNTVAICQKHQIGIIPYSPLAQGLVSGKFTLENRPTDNRANNHLFKDPTYGLAIEAVKQLQTLAQKYGATTAQIALAWLIAQPGVTSPIVGARNEEQIKSTSIAAEISLEESDLKAMSQLATPVLESQPEDKTNPWAG